MALTENVAVPAAATVTLAGCVWMLGEGGAATVSLAALEVIVGVEAPVAPVTMTR